MFFVSKVCFVRLVMADIKHLILRYAIANSKLPSILSQYQYQFQDQINFVLDESYSLLNEDRDSLHFIHNPPSC